MISKFIFLTQFAYMKIVCLQLFATHAVCHHLLSESVLRYFSVTVFQEDMIDISSSKLLYLLYTQVLHDETYFKEFTKGYFSI